MLKYTLNYIIRNNLYKILVEKKILKAIIYCGQNVGTWLSGRYSVQFVQNCLILVALSLNKNYMAIHLFGYTFIFKMLLIEYLLPVEYEGRPKENSTVVSDIPSYT